MARQISSREDISKILDLDQLSDPKDVLSESDEDCIPQGDVLESEEEWTMQTIGERVHLRQTNLQMAFPTFHEHA